MKEINYKEIAKSTDLKTNHVKQILKGKRKGKLQDVIKIKLFLKEKLK